MVEPTRRSLLFMLGGGVLATTLGGSVLAGSETRSPSRVADTASLRKAEESLRRSRFAPGTGKVFSARGDQGSYRLRLTEISDVQHAPGPGE